MDLTLRRRRPPPSLDTLEEGQVVRGKVRKVEKFGVFVELDGSGAVGLAHVSELADGFVKDVAELFKVDQRELIVSTGPHHAWWLGPPCMFHLLP